MTAREVIDDVVAEMREYSRTAGYDLTKAEELIPEWANRLEALAPPADLAGVVYAHETSRRTCCVRWPDGEEVLYWNDSHVRHYFDAENDAALARAGIATPASNPSETVSKVEGGEVVAWLRHRPDGSPDWAEDCIAEDEHFLDGDMAREGYTLRPLTYAPPCATQPAVVTDAMVERGASVSTTGRANDPQYRAKVRRILAAALAPGGGS